MILKNDDKTEKDIKVKDDVRENCSHCTVGDGVQGKGGPR